MGDLLFLSGLLQQNLYVAYDITPIFCAPKTKQANTNLLIFTYSNKLKNRQNT